MITDDLEFDEIFANFHISYRPLNATYELRGGCTITANILNNDVTFIGDPKHTLFSYVRNMERPERVALCDWLRTQPINDIVGA